MRSATLARGMEAAVTAARWLAIVGLTLLLLLAATTVLDGLMRWIFRFPLDIIRDVGGLIAAVSISCCMPLALLKSSHISIHFLDNQLSPRWQNVMALFAASATTCIVALMAWQFMVYAGKMARAGEVTIMLRVHMAPFWFVVAGLMMLSLAAQCLMLGRAIHQFMLPAGHLGDE